MPMILIVGVYQISSAFKFSINIGTNEPMCAPINGYVQSACFKNLSKLSEGKTKAGFILSLWVLLTLKISRQS